MIADSLREALDRVVSKTQPRPTEAKPTVFRFEVLRPLHFRGEPHKPGDILHATLTEARGLPLGDTSAAINDAPRCRIVPADRDALLEAIRAEQARENTEAQAQRPGWVKRW
jgi:hypothetical protein